MIPLPKLRPRNVDMSPEAIEQRLRDVSDLYQLCLSLQSAKRIGTVAEVRERERLEAEAASGQTATNTNTNTNDDLNEDAPQ